MKQFVDVLILRNTITTKLLIGQILLFFLLGCNTKKTSNNKEEPQSPTEVVTQQQKDLEYKDLNQRWYEVIYQTVALETNKELEKNNRKKMDEKTLHEFTKCCHSKITAKYPDIYQLVNKDGELNKMYTNEFNNIMEECFNDIVKPYVNSKK